MSRPEALFPLFAGIDTLPGVGPRIAAAFAGLDVTRPRDLIFTLPSGGVQRLRVASVRDVVAPAHVVVEVEVIAHHAPARRSGPTRVSVRDAQAEFTLVYFRAHPDSLNRLLPPGARRIIAGKLEQFDGHAQMVHPDHVLPPGDADALPAFEPVYPLAAGLTAKVVAKAAAAALTRLPGLAEWIDLHLLAREGWPDWASALRAAHTPAGPQDLAPTDPNRARLAYDELFAHQITLALARRHLRRGKGRPTQATGRLRDQVLASLPYAPTTAQTRAVAEITADMATDRRMNRLLQGDVGAGKTLVAFLALLGAVEAGGQGVMMAPTEILARQHMEGLHPLAAAAGVRIALLTGRDKGADRRARLADLAAGKIDILVGTHAVFSADVVFSDLRLAVVDEQHRFGVAQRMELASKGIGADVLVMTATPIPRSLALAQHGDMDISVLDEKPPGRQPITTVVVATDRMQEVVGHLARAVAEGRQAYWVCPLVEDSERVDLTSAEDRFASLRAALGPDVVGLVHGQLTPAEKDEAMADFVAGRSRVLVATTVIEVGVNVPSATIMVIERAESFGLAQLHQLRGRVGRGSDASSCVLMYQAPLGASARRRLQVLRNTEDGFRIAEEDLALRGAGDLIGTAQSGLPRFRIADLEHQTDLMALAQSDARALMALDPDLTGPRGLAVRSLLWLLERDQAIRLITVG